MLPEKVLRQAQAELLGITATAASVMEMSHRSKWFDAIIKDTENHHAPRDEHPRQLQGGLLPGRCHPSSLPWCR